MGPDRRLPKPLAALIILALAAAGWAAITLAIRSFT